MCLKVSNDLKILIYGNENLELKQKVHIPNNNKNFYYQVDVVLSRKKQNDKIFVNLNGLRLFDGKNRLNVQTDLNNNNLQVTCKDLKECDIAACKLQMAHVNDRMTIIFKDKKLPRIDLRISNVIREQFDISFYIRIYKNVASSIINNTIVHYLITYFMNIKWDNIIRQTKKLELDFFMSGLLKNYFFNNLWQHICWKLYIDCEDMYNLTNKNDNSLDNTENVKFEEYIQLVSSKLDGLFLELKDIISITQIEKQNRFFDSIKDFEVNHEFIKTEIKNPNKENMDHQKFALSIYTEKKDRFIDKISPNASLDSINIFSNKPILSYTNSTTEQENTSDEENKEEAEEESFVTTSDGKFNINRKYIDKDLINFRLDGY
ncbi:hypothetical protein HANVADRAFT_52387 [Hanseniaspora valbyensis NRRL Y-1626]|uniref:Uncharacterized protein n=1 Tax=Hanseniaspora valbyensis NRRL Y-1626 TaxID=766949 RepID=A0A1B7TF44_9ASCO|nr:hypothetical protein HANVADRAFT_52387 [Hanseniaspora valbyensis NRRL Y-1626]